MENHCYNSTIVYKSESSSCFSIIDETSWWQRTSGCFPFFIFSSSWLAARRTRFWREAKLMLVEQYYVRDKTGSIWLFLMEESKSWGSLNMQILGYPVDKLFPERVREMFYSRCCYVRLDTEYDYFQKILFIHDIIVHPEYRRRNTGKFLIKEALDYYARRGVTVEKISGRIAPDEMYGMDDMHARDSFWKNLGFEFKDKGIKTIETTPDKLNPGKIKTRRIQPDEYLREIDFEVQHEIIIEQMRLLQALKDSLQFERDKPCLFRISETLLRCIRSISDSIRKLFPL